MCDHPLQHNPSHSTDSRMCLSTFPTMSVARMRHWSCPEKLPSSSYLETDDEEYEDIGPRYKEAEDISLDDYSRVDIKSIRVLAAWERRLMSLREARMRKTSSKLRPEADDDVVSNTIDDAKEDTSVSSRQTSSNSNIVTEKECLPSVNNQVTQPSCNYKLNFQSQIKQSSSSSLPALHSAVRPCCNDSDDPVYLSIDVTENISKTSRDHLAVNSSDSRPASTKVKGDRHVKDDQTVTCHSSFKSSYSRLFKSYFLCILLPILSSLSSVTSPLQSSVRVTSPSRHRRKEPDKLLLVSGLALLLFTPVTCLQVGDEPFLGPHLGHDDGPVCSDGIYRGNININNKEEGTKMSSLQKYWNCSVVEGSISITSALYAMDQDWRNYSLPNLVEVTDFVLLYRANEIDSMETLFPKLSVIRGHKLVQFYALAIYQMKNMVRVGLPSLTHIMNGGVRIEKNPLLCYVDTVNWRKIVVQKNDRDSHIEIIGNQEANKCQVSSLKECPVKCSGGCWSLESCQKVVVPCPAGTDYKGQEMCYRNNRGEEGRPCHRECIGGCQDTDQAVNNPRACVACNHTRSLTDPREFTCVPTCPAPYVAYKDWLCVTKEECSERNVAGIISMDPAKSVYKVHDDKCVDKCPNGYKAIKVGNIWQCEKCQNCPVHCDGEIINSPESAKKLKSCTHINGDIVINVNKGDIAIELEENLKDIVEITGSLKIERSHSLVSLHFFKSLKKIRNSGGYAPKTLTIFENENLQKLFPEDHDLDLGSDAVVFIHYNPMLCMKEIQKFLEKSGVKHVEDHLISPLSNGNKMVCSEEKLSLNVIPGGPELLKLEYKNYLQNLELKGDIDINSLLGYHVFYREVSEQQFANKSITKFDGMTACGSSAWNVIFVDDPQRYTTYTAEKPCIPGPGEKCVPINDADPSLMMKITYSDVVTYIPNCKPYTPYAIYVTTVMEKTLADGAAGAQSDIVYARTNGTNPSPVSKLTANSPTPHSLDISWEPPLKPNGVIDRYFLEISYLRASAGERNYCQQKTGDKEQEPVKTTPASIIDTDEEDNGQCPVCESCGKEDDTKTPAVVPPETKAVISEKAFHDDIINKVFPVTTSVGITEDQLLDVLSRRKKRSVSDSRTSNSLMVDVKKIVSVVNIQAQRNGPIKKLSLENMTIEMTEYMGRVVVSLPGNMTRVTVDRLRHFTNYEVRVLACHGERAGQSGRYRACSDDAILNTKTTFKQGADDILSSEVFTHSGNGSEGIIKWYPPSDPNDQIVHYQLSRSPDQSPNNAFIKCISLSEIQTVQDEDGRELMVYHLTDDGEYYIRLQPVSLFDEGSWTRFQFVRVNSNKSSTILMIVLLFFALLLIGMSSLGGYTYWKKKNGTSDNPWWSSHNPDYIDTTKVYPPDPKWEVKRDDVKLMEELGKGSFGMVYRGIYNHPDQGETLCAVKTVNEKSTYHDQLEFLEEASGMKDLNTEHVIKLIGVVSEGQPALVLMELMENGDLKNYLRALRPDSENNRLNLPVPTISEILQMAIEIADGMSYLSVKKIAHRDLAARNCMVSNNVVVKVGDFGMARDIYETEYYRKQGKGLLPVRWMAPESIKDGKFSTESDVWSFGVVLWEMATLAEQPYQGLSNDEVMKYVKDGNKMNRPENCPDILFELMLDCWHWQPSERPTFLQICQRLLDRANDRWRETCFFLTPEGREAVIRQEEDIQDKLRREAEDNADALTPLTSDHGHNGNGVTGDNNGHISGESHPLVSLRPNARSPTQVHFSNESGYSSGSRAGSRGRLSMNGFVQRIRNMSGSASGEA